MKNLKKSLALVLAIVMVFSLCIFANAAFVDQDKIGAKYETATGVMNGLGILKGDENGVFDPQGYLTRGQACKIIAYIKLGAKLADTLAVSAAPFNDVKATDWAAPFIAYCKTQKIVSGYGDGNFGPEDKLTGFQFGKMLLVALGYGQNGEYEGEGWEMNVAQDAAAAGVYAANLEGATSELISRELAAQLAFNAIYVKPVAYSKIFESYSASGKPFAESPLDVASEAVKGATDKAGRPVTRYVSITKNAYGQPTTIYEQADEPLAVITNGQFNTLYGAYKDWITTGAKTIVDGKTTTQTVDGKDVVVFDEKNFAASDIYGKPGRVAELYGTKTALGVTVNTVVVTDYVFATVKDINATTGAITLSIGANKTETYEKSAIDPSYLALSAFAKGDALCLTYCNGKVATAVKADAVTGDKVTARSAATYTAPATFKIDGTQYPVAYTFADRLPELGKIAGTYYLDPNGYVIGYAGAYVSTDEDIVYVNDVYTVEETGAYGIPMNKYYVLAVNADGEIVSYQTADNTYGGVTITNNELTKGLYSVTTLYNPTAKAELATFDAPSASYYAVKTKTFSDSDKLASTAVKVVIDGDNNNYYFDSNVKFIFVNGILSDLTATVKDGVQALAGDTKVTYAAKNITGTNNYNVKVVFVENAVSAVVSKDIVFISGDTTSTSSTYVTNALGVQVPGFAKTVYIDGVKTDIYVGDAAAKEDGFYRYTISGDLYTLGETKIEDADNLVGPSVITNVYGSLITTDTLADVNVANATFVNMTTDLTKTGVDKLVVGNEIAVVKDLKGDASIVYLTNAGIKNGNPVNLTGTLPGAADSYKTAVAVGAAFCGVGGPSEPEWAITSANATKYIAWRLPGDTVAELTVVKKVSGVFAWTYSTKSSATSTAIGWTVKGDEFVNGDMVGGAGKVMGAGEYTYTLNIGGTVYYGSFTVADDAVVIPSLTA